MAHTHIHVHENEDTPKVRIAKIAIGTAVFLLGILFFKLPSVPQWLSFPVFIVAYIFLGIDVVIGALKNITHGKIFDEYFLMSVSTIGAFIIGEYPEAVAVMLFYQIGELLQDIAVDKSTRSIEKLMDIRPDVAYVKRDTIFAVHPAEVKIGETIVVRPGERIPLDGIVRDGMSVIDTSALTGESVPRAIGIGDSVLSGCINKNGALEIKVTEEFSNSTVSKIINLVKEAVDKKAPAEKFITKFARYYTPAVVFAAIIIALVPGFIFNNFAKWIYRGLIFLVISCPCALVISIPLTFFGGLGAASRRGILIKGSNYLEALNNVNTVVFDKTGTLTKGTFRVTEVKTANDFTEEQLLLLAASAESLSTHPIAQSIVEANRARGGLVAPKESIKNYREIPGHGITAIVSGYLILVGNPKLLKAANINFTEIFSYGTKVYVAANGEYVGCIIISDEIKEDARQTVLKLAQMGIKRTIMLSGDNEESARAVADQVGLKYYYADLLPHHKVKKMEEIMKAKHEGGNVVFVGDGINDAPVLARADIGIAMGEIGSDAAIEAADVVLMTDEPTRLIDAINIAKKTNKIVKQNIFFAIGVKLLLLILGAFGIIDMWLAIFGDVGVMLVAVINSLGILKTERRHK
ncbi:MAG: cadmium-translocating P-type ATPase [Ruminococcaceae bacterium]|nr:cadmium-translocating P-type ATPase [Oscillospiraceae bacterium]